MQKHVYLHTSPKQYTYTRQTPERRVDRNHTLWLWPQLRINSDMDSDQVGLVGEKDSKLLVVVWHVKPVSHEVTIQHYKLTNYQGNKRLRIYSF